MSGRTGPLGRNPTDTAQTPLNDSKRESTLHPQNDATKVRMRIDLHLPSISSQQTVAHRQSHTFPIPFTALLPYFPIVHHAIDVLNVPTPSRRVSLVPGNPTHASSSGPRPDARIPSRVRPV